MWLELEKGKSYWEWTSEDVVVVELLVTLVEICDPLCVTVLEIVDDVELKVVLEVDELDELLL